MTVIVVAPPTVDQPTSLDETDALSLLTVTSRGLKKTDSPGLRGIRVPLFPLLLEYESNAYTCEQQETVIAAPFSDCFSSMHNAGRRIF